MFCIFEPKGNGPIHFISRLMSHTKTLQHAYLMYPSWIKDMGTFFFPEKRTPSIIYFPSSGKFLRPIWIHKPYHYSSMVHMILDWRLTDSNFSRHSSYLQNSNFLYFLLTKCLQLKHTIEHELLSTTKHGQLIQLTYQ